MAVTVADALIGNVNILKGSNSAQIVRKVAFPACWLLEFLAVWSLFRINKMECLYSPKYHLTTLYGNHPSGKPPSTTQSARR